MKIKINKPDDDDKPKIKVTPKKKKSNSKPLNPKDIKIKGTKTEFESQADALRKKVTDKDPTLKTTTRLKPSIPQIERWEKAREDKKTS